MMQRYAQLADLWPRVIVGVPVLTPWLSSQWINLVTPVPKAIAQPLIESLRNSAVARESDIRGLGATHEPASFDAAVIGALADLRHGTAGAAAAIDPTRPGGALATDPSWSGGTVYVDERSTDVAADHAVVWKVIEGIGGRRGWYSSPAAWAARGMIDRLVGGVGLSRGRLDPDRLEPGASLDFWLVEAIERGRLLRLRAEMRLPGEAWLEFRVEPAAEGSRLSQRATFIPHGLPGILYWRAVTPFHDGVFGSMLRNVAATATATAA